MRRIAWPVAALFALAWTCGEASAQFRPGYPGGAGPYSNPYQRPAFSPYLNIIGRGNPAINYYGITRPQMDMRNGMMGGYGGGGPGYGPEDPTDPELRRGTGHIVTFNNLSHFYYNNPAMGMQGMGGMGMGGAASFGRIGGGVGGMGGFGNAQGAFGAGAGFNSGFPGGGGARRGGSFGVQGGIGIPRR